MGDSRSPVIAVVPESKVCASAPNSDPIQVASVVSLLVRLEGDHSDEVASATEVSKLGFICMEVTNRRKRDATTRLMGLGIDVSSDNRHHGVTQNHFSHLSDLGSQKGLYFGERDNSTVVSGEKGEKWSNPITKPMSSSYLDGVELL